MPFLQGTACKTPLTGTTCVGDASLSSLQGTGTGGLFQGCCHLCCTWWGDGERLRYPWAIQVYDWIPFFSKCCSLMPQWHFTPGLFYWTTEEQQEETLNCLVDAACCTLSFMAAYTRSQCIEVLGPCLGASQLYSEHKRQSFWSSCRTSECGSFCI